MTPDELLEKKRALRSFLLKKRQELSSSRRALAHKKLFESLSIELSVFRSVLSFVPIKKEIDLTKINQILCKDGKLHLPKVCGESLAVYQITSLERLKKSSLGIYEPLENYAKKKEHDSIDCILVPALGFDENYHRLGYGKGHYDRFLQDYKGITIGVGYKEQLFHDFLPVGDHDISLGRLLLF